MITLVETKRQGTATELNRPHPRRKILGGIGVNYLVEFLKVMQIERRAADMYRASPWVYKKSMLNGVRWCLDRDLIARRIQFKSSFKNRKDPKVFYKITDKGMDLLRLIR